MSNFILSNLPVSKIFCIFVGFLKKGMCSFHFASFRTEIYKENE